MKGLQLIGHGDPSDVVELVELVDVGSPAPNEVVIDVLATPIEPTDLMMIAGTYGFQPALPHNLGAQGVGRVTAAGSAVTHLREGDLTLVPPLSNAWVQRTKTDAPYLRPLPDANLNQLSMLAINPPAAYLMLTDFVRVDAGGWVIQNAANSAIGRSVVSLAKLLGLRTINIVRRPDAVDAVKTLGADVVLIDGPNLPDRIAAATDGAEISLALDGVGGNATQRLLDSVSNYGTVVVYSGLSGEPFTVSGSRLVFRGQSVRGFWLVNWFNAQSDFDAVLQAYEKLAPLVADGTINYPVLGTFPLERHREALALASELRGKVIFAPNAS